MAGTSVAVDSPLIGPGDCTRRTTWNATVCATGFGSIFVIGLDTRGRSPGPVRVSLVSSAPGGAGPAPFDPLRSMLLFGNPQPAADAIFQTNVRSGRPYTVYFRHQFSAHLRLGLHHFAAGERLTLIFPQAPRSVMLENAGTKPGSVLSHGVNGALMLDLSTDAAGVPAQTSSICAQRACAADAACVV